MTKRKCWAVLIAGLLLAGVAASADTAKDANEKGKSCLEREDFDAAVAAFTEAIRLDPKDTTAYRNRGIAHQKIGETAKAEEDFEQAKKLGYKEGPSSIPGLVHTAPAHLAQRFMPWLTLACLAILFAAAFLHWLRTRHWCLLALATGSLVAALANIAMQITVATQIGSDRISICDAASNLVVGRSVWFRHRGCRRDWSNPLGDQAKATQAAESLTLVANTLSEFSPLPGGAGNRQGG